MSHFADLVGPGPVDLETLVRAHLASKCYPPVDQSWVGPAVSAINLAVDCVIADDYTELEDRTFDSDAEGRPMSAQDAIIGLHLEAFVGALLAVYHAPDAEVPDAPAD